MVVVSGSVCTPACTPERRSMRRQLRSGMGMGRDVIDTHGWQAEVQEGVVVASGAISARRVPVHDGAAVERTRLHFSSYHIELLIAAIAEVAESVGGQWYGGYGWTGRASELGAGAQKRQRQAARAQAITEIRPERRGVWPRRTGERQRRRAVVSSCCC